MINRIRFDGQDPARMEIIAVTDSISIPRRNQSTGSSSAKAKVAKGSHALGQTEKGSDTGKPEQIEIQLGELERAILAKVVQKCGNRLYWDEWAQDIARIAQTHITRLTTILENPANTEEIVAFDNFVNDLHADLNDEIIRAEAIEMLAQHLITRPVFDAMFQGYSFAEHNPVSKAMQSVLTVLERHNLQKETDTLTRLYDSVRHRAEETRTLVGKQKLIAELYDKFFQNAFPKLRNRLGIIYTPVEVVDFIIHSVNDVLKAEFRQSLGSRNVHIMDPFTGTGTFITRLLQSGLIAPEEMAHKYAREIHANEIVLLAYYIAAINIEQVYHSVTGAAYEPFGGICLTDTFNLPTGKTDLIGQASRDNSARLKRQRSLDIRVIMGNPPYSVGQDSDNEVSANLKYPSLDARIQATYVANSTGNPRSLYDSYIKAIRWASDRIGASGIVAFVSNAGWLEGKAADGLRRVLSKEFSTIYVLHLRGLRGRKTSGERAKWEGGQIFGAASGAAICILVLVRNPARISQATLHFCDIGSYLSRSEKLARISEMHSIDGISATQGWRLISLDVHGDWLKRRDDSFSDYISMGSKKKKYEAVIFSGYTSGVKTNRDAWAYNSSRQKLQSNMKNMIDFYESCLRGQNMDNINNPKQISWSYLLRERFDQSEFSPFNPELIGVSSYRPFYKSWLYYDGFYNENRYRMLSLYPNVHSENLAIGVSASESRSGFSVLMTKCIPSLHAADMVGSQYFPLYLYDGPSQKAANSSNDPLFDDAPPASPPTRRDAITDAALARFLAAYPGEAISKEDLFYYVYAMLHSEEYRTRFADNLAKELPRVPAVKDAADFRAFSQAGRTLAALHVDYETVDMYPATLVVSKPRESLTPADWRVEKMAFSKGHNGARHDKTIVTYNHNVTIRDIPSEAYDYVVNGKPALEWVMERQAVTTHKDSSIVNDANDWAVETMNNPAYPLELFLHVITVSLETMKIVRTLPALDID